jgi:hypothetical protein
MVRWVSVGVCVFFFLGSYFMAQLDYINLFVTIVCSLWLGGCGPVMIFGLYSKFGTKAGAWASLLTGMFFSAGCIFVQRKWASLIYPFLSEHNLVEAVGRWLETLSRPFNPYIVWKMNAVKCPINSNEFYFISMVSTIIIYCVVSYCTLKEPFNLERLLHRGKYDTGCEKKAAEKWTLKSIFRHLLGITPEYTRLDKFIAWFLFCYSLIFGFGIMFLGVIFWNRFSGHPWTNVGWSRYIFVKFLAVPSILAMVSAVWFGIGGVRDLLRLFKDLKTRKVNALDNGLVDGNVSLADKETFQRLEK